MNLIQQFQALQAKLPLIAILRGLTPSEAVPWALPCNRPVLACGKYR